MATEHVLTLISKLHVVLDILPIVSQLPHFIIPFNFLHFREEFIHRPADFCFFGSQLGVFTVITLARHLPITGKLYLRRFESVMRSLLEFLTGVEIVFHSRNFGRPCCSY